MAVSKTKKRTTSKKRSNAKQQSVSGGFQNEIILLVILAACIILLVSNFGMGGFVGDAISSFCFGSMGLMAYVFPILLFIGCAFILSNKKNHLAYKKLSAGIVLFVCICGIMQLLTEGYTKSTELMDYYALCSDYRTGGGVIGGAICISITSAFGVVGGYVIIGLVVLVCLILITQHSFLDFVMGIGTRLCNLVKGGHERYQEGKPERDLKREVRAQQKRQLKEERRAERIRQLEMELAQDEEEETPAAQSQEELFLDPRQARRKMFSLDGTDLTALTSQSTDQPSSAPEFEIHRSEPLTDLTGDEEEISYEEPVNAMEEDTPFLESKEGKTASKNPKSSPAEIQNGIINIQHEITKQEPAVKPEYKFPPLNLLKKGSGKSQGDSDAHLRKTAQKLQEVLFNFGVNVTVTNVSCGPTVTRYELQPEMGVKVSKIVSLADDIKLNLATPDIRIEAPIPGKAAVGIEVPNKENSAVMLRDLLQSDEFRNAKSKLAFAAGKDIAGKPVVTDIAKMPHLLIAGATGSGKSVCINTLIMSILYKATPDEVKLIMIDPKVVELSVYNGIPHLFIPVVTDPKKAAGALNWAVSEMTTRYNTFAEYGVRNLTEYNKKISCIPVTEGETAPEKMPQIVIIVDELADLMMVAPGEVEDAICRLAQLARAAGIHLIIATQRPSVNVITGLIKANMPSRIAFSVSSGVDSRTILDMNGAEKLLGKGDMLFYPQGYQKPARLQGAFVSDEEVSSVVEFLANKNPAVSYNQQIEQQVNSPLSGGAGGEERDIYFTDAGKFIVEKEKASIGMLQRVFKIGFNRAARIMDQLCDAGVVGPEEGTKPRKVLMTMEEFENYIEESL
ncbi:MAG: DNA translocase FtsK [Blautia sp.]|nr:DNA translocase FtsK [Blautia sp.]